MKTLPRPLIMSGLLALCVASMSAGRVWVPWSDWAAQRGDPGVPGEGEEQQPRPLDHAPQRAGLGGAGRRRELLR